MTSLRTKLAYLTALSALLIAALAACSGDDASGAGGDAPGGGGDAPGAPAPATASAGGADGGGAGDAATRDAGSATPDASSAPRDASSPPANDAGDAGAASCAPARAPASDGHPADYDCMAAGCHGPGAAVAGLLITVSGTLHGSADGGPPLGGATVVVTDSNGKTIELVTSPNGIFWSGVSDGGSVPAGPQGTCPTGTCATYAAAGAMTAVTVSACPNAPRACQNPASGECANCHTAGQAGQSSVHLP